MTTKQTTTAAKVSSVTRIVANDGNEFARLQAGDEKHHALDQIGQEVPEHDAREPGRRGNQANAAPTDIEPGGHCGQHAGAAELFGRPVGDERRQDREHDLDAGIADPTAQAKHEPSDADSPHDLSHEDGRKAAGGLDKRERSSHHRGDREAIEDERGRVVGQAFALENDDQALGKLQSLRDRQRGNGVGRRDDGAQDKADRPGKAQQPVRSRGDRDRGEHDTTDRQQRDRAQVEAELFPTHLHCVPVDDGRQHEH